MIDAYSPIHVEKLICLFTHKSSPLPAASPYQGGIFPSTGPAGRKNKPTSLRSEKSNRLAPLAANKRAPDHDLHDFSHGSSGFRGFHQKPGCHSPMPVQLKNNTCIVIIVTDVAIGQVRRNSRKRRRFYIPARPRSPAEGRKCSAFPSQGRCRRSRRMG